ncbi:hypothetical protein P5V15_002383 [Pogonomyrmex californicus]
MIHAFPDSEGADYRHPHSLSRRTSSTRRSTNESKCEAVLWSTLDGSSSSRSAAIIRNSVGRATDRDVATFPSVDSRDYFNVLRLRQRRRRRQQQRERDSWKESSSSSSSRHC